eukprot:g1074.t1
MGELLLRSGSVSSIGRAHEARKAIQPSTNEEREAEHAAELRVFSESELRAFDGRSANERILIAYRLTVFDVSSEPGLYAKDGPYHAFAGRACTRGVVLPSLKEEDINDDVADFNQEKMAKLEEWTKFFKAKYKVVGRLQPDLKAKEEREAKKQTEAKKVAAIVAAKKAQPNATIYTLAKLSLYNGTDPSLPILLAVAGHVLDVSSASQFFGPGASRSVWAGKEISRALALQSAKEEDINSEVGDLSAEQLEVLERRIDYFLGRFPKVGVVMPASSREQQPPPVSGGATTSTAAGAGAGGAHGP